MQKMTKLIYQRNVITAARYVFTVVEKRLLYVIATRLNEMSENLFGELVLQIPVKSLLKDDDDENYTRVKLAALSLLKKVIEVKTPLRWEAFTILSGAVIDKGSGVIEITLSHHIVPYFVNLKKEGEVTRLGFNNAMSLKGAYSQRFYEYCSRFKDTGWMTFDLDDLRKQLKLESKYHLWGDFKRRVLESAQKELAEKTELGFSWTPIKEGKRIIRLDFKIFSTEKKDETKFIDSNLNINYRTLRDRLRLSDYQAKLICSNVTDKEIKDTLYDIQLHKDKIQSLPSYSWSAFTNKFPQLQNKAA